ncbi:MAG: efflux RND transporter permease subunit, partial [Alphaproteobacteria bacterium]|nr:efflux RND transporter permease subunit [Alphaproteobacteria bacterium]
MNLSTWAIRTPIPAIVIFLMATVAGLYATKQLGIQDFPDMDVPVVMVTAGLQGASPSQLETEVTRHIEDAIATVGDVKHMTSTVTEGTSTTAVEFIFEKDVNEALDDVRDAVQRVRADLPSEMVDPTISKVKIVGGWAMQTFSVSSERMDEEAISWYVDNTVSRAMLGVKGVGQVSRVGGVTREVRVELDPAKMQSLNITAADVSRQLRASQQELSGGASEVGGMRQSFRVIGTVERAAELERFEITSGDGRRFRLDQIATIHDTSTDRTQLALLDNQPVVAFSISRAQGVSAVTVAEGTVAAVEKLNAENPAFHIKLVNNSIDNIIEQYEGSMHMLYEGALLAVIVVWFFLRDWRATLVSASALPLSVIPTFAAIYFFGFSLNVITLLALTLVIGLLVDDAIVEIENIVRHLRKGKTVREAAEEAVNEIGLAVVATTMTLVAVFLPTAFMSGIPGLIFKQFGWTATIAVLASLAVARLLTPMMAAYMLKPHEEKERPDGRLMRWYMRFV